MERAKRMYHGFGWTADDKAHSFGPVTVGEAKAEATTRGLKAYHLGPVDYVESGAHTISYVRDKTGHYRVVPMWQFLEECYHFAEIYPSDLRERRRG